MNELGEVEAAPPVLPTEEQRFQFERAAARLESLYGKIQMTHLRAEPAFEKVVSMGPAVIQPILDRLSQGVNFWFMPLEEIVRDNIDEDINIQPVKGDFSNSRTWTVNYDRIYEGNRRGALLWGQQNGYRVTLPEK